MARWVAAWVLVSFLFGCGSNKANTDGGVSGPGDKGTAGRDGVGPQTDGKTTGGQSYSFLLSGDQMTPRMQSAGSGTATLTISPDKSQIDVSVVVSNLGGLTGAEIQVGEVGTPGPAIFILSTQAFVNPLQVTLRAGDLKPQPSSGVGTFAEAIAAINSGMVYLVVKTTNAQHGELRGQIGVVTLDSQLSSDQLQPPGKSSASATAKVVVAGDQKSIAVTLTPRDVVDGTGAFIQAGGPGANGPVIFKITTEKLSGTVNTILKAGDLTPQPGQGITTFADAIDAVLNGTTYIQVNTAINPNGEIRGHVGRMTLNANLTGTAMVPPVTTTANAGAQVTLPNSRKLIHVNLNAGGITNITGAVIHVGETGSNGPPIFEVATSSFEGTVEKILAPTDLKLQSGNGISNFADAIHLMIRGGTYFVIMTSDHPAGFLRGQIGAF